MQAVPNSPLPALGAIRASQEGSGRLRYKGGVGPETRKAEGRGQQAGAGPSLQVAYLGAISAREPLTTSGGRLGEPGQTRPGWPENC